MLIIESVVPGSPAEDLGILPGDGLLQVNALPLRDLVDFHRATQAEQLLLEILRDGEVMALSCDRYAGEDLGLVLEHPQPRQCGNQCIFCFVHQLPKGLRRSLYIKDEDYRFSYLYGSFITLTNLTEPDLQRIITEQLSPLYISVHATDSSVRDRLLGCACPAILPLLQRLSAGGIELHCQIVLCPGINDGPVLKQTITDLVQLQPAVSSIAVVPVGLTRHRQHLPPLNPLTASAAQSCLQLVHQRQQQYLKDCGHRLVFAADELYLLAGAEIPAAEAYEDFPQLENGVGLLAQFREQIEDVLLEAEPLSLAAAVLVTGRSFAAELQQFAARLSLRTDVALEVIAIDNQLFGATVTVAGLVSGGDLLLQLRDKVAGRPLILPDVMLAADQDLFLDDLSLTDLGAALQVPVQVVEASAWGLLEGLERLADGPVDVIRC
ncbi:MAG: DUF512 domain-containing protein [Pelovirga sp.]